MDWNRAIDVNRAALTQVVAEIFVVLQLALEGAVTRLPREAYLVAEGLLRPTESALRRLLVIAARGLTVAVAPPRPMPKGLAIVRTQTKRTPSFRLFDSRKHLDFDHSEDAPDFVLPSGSHIRTIESFLQSRTVVPPVAASFDASSLCRRFAALKYALDTLPRQALRMARWQLRRKSMPNAKFISPLRPGPPPGIRQRSKIEIHRVLRECHDLAHYALSLDSS